MRVVRDSLRSDLESCYEEIMYLADRPNVSPQRARAWYSSVRREQFKRSICMFTGMVSEKAIVDVNENLVLEHPERLSYTISKLISKHAEDKTYNPEEFVDSVIRCEKVNITTDRENHAVRKAEGDYESAKIILIEWRKIDEQRRIELWKNKLNGAVANADEFE